eukprot:291392-Pelagomonas_calceolata.AAC.1
MRVGFLCLGVWLLLAFSLQANGAKKSKGSSKGPSMDFYERLGVPRDADDRTLKKAYRQAGAEGSGPNRACTA